MIDLRLDICRCHDSGCPDAPRCARHIEREAGHDHAASLFPYDIQLGDPCPWHIPVTSPPRTPAPATPPGSRTDPATP